VSKIKQIYIRSAILVKKLKKSKLLYPTIFLTGLFVFLPQPAQANFIVNWVIRPLSALVALLNEKIASALGNTLLQKTSQIIVGGGEFDTISQVVEHSWHTMLTLSNSIFLLALIIAAIAIILHINTGTYNFKKFLGALVGGIILANLSLPMVRLLIDLGDVLIQGAQNMLGQNGGSLWIELNKKVFGEGASTSFTFSLIILAVQIVGLIAMFKLLLVFLQRTVTLIILAIISPLIFPLGLLPSGAEYQKKWWSTFMSWLFVGPAAFFLIGLAGILVSHLGNLQDELASNATTISNQFLLNIIWAAIIIGLVWIAGETPKYVGAATAGIVGSANKWMGKALGKGALRGGHTIGKGFDYFTGATAGLGGGVTSKIRGKTFKEGFTTPFKKARFYKGIRAISTAVKEGAAGWGRAGAYERKMYGRPEGLGMAANVLKRLGQKEASKEAELEANKESTKIVKELGLPEIAGNIENYEKDLTPDTERHKITAAFWALGHIATASEASGIPEETRARALKALLEHQDLIGKSYRGDFTKGIIRSAINMAQAKGKDRKLKHPKMHETLIEYSQGPMADDYNSSKVIATAEINRNNELKKISNSVSRDIFNYENTENILQQTSPKFLKDIVNNLTLRQTLRQIFKDSDRVTSEEEALQMLIIPNLKKKDKEPTEFMDKLKKDPREAKKYLEARKVVVTLDKLNDLSAIAKAAKVTKLEELSSYIQQGKVPELEQFINNVNDITVKKPDMLKPLQSAIGEQETIVKTKEVQENVASRKAPEYENLAKSLIEKEKEGMPGSSEKQIAHSLAEQLERIQNDVRDKLKKENIKSDTLAGKVLEQKELQPIFNVLEKTGYAPSNNIKNWKQLARKMDLGSILQQLRYTHRGLKPFLPEKPNSNRNQETKTS